MQFSIELSDNEKYILCEITGEFTAAEAQKFSKEMDALSRESGCKNILIDMRNARNKSNVFENYDFVYRQMSRLDLKRDVVISVLISPGDHSHDFVETLMLNAGYSVRSFNDQKNAIAWFER